MAAEYRNSMSVMVTSRDVLKSVEFYRDGLGFELKEAWPSKEAPQWANLTLDGQSIMVGAAMDPAKVGEMCAGDTDALTYWTKASTDFQNNVPGVGVVIYVKVDNIDAFAKAIAERGVQYTGQPKDQFYGIRELGIDDPDGYRLTLFSPAPMTQCQSCGMPMTDAVEGQMYCDYCTNEQGELRSYEEVLQGTTHGYFVAQLEMPVDQAARAAKEHLAKMPAWSSRS